MFLFWNFSFEVGEESSASLCEHLHLCSVRIVRNRIQSIPE
jgi:hypothetical protein